MIAEKPGDLIESNVILDLNEPCALADVSWIKPAKVVFPWWPAFRAGRRDIPDTMSTANQKYYIDFASKSGIEYLELEPPWYSDEQGCLRAGDRLVHRSPWAGCGAFVRGDGSRPTPACRKGPYSRKLAGVAAAALPDHGMPRREARREPLAHIEGREEDDVHARPSGSSRGWPGEILLRQAYADAQNTYCLSMDMSFLLNRARLGHCVFIQAARAIRRPQRGSLR